MVKKNAEGKAAPKKPAVKRAPAKDAGNATREALKDDPPPMTSEQAAQPDKAPAGGWGEDTVGTPKEGDRRHDEAAGIDVVYRGGRWVPAAGQSWFGDGASDGPLTDEPIVHDDQVNVDQVEAGVADDPPPAGEQGTIGWGLDGKEQIVDEEGEDASEAGKVKKSRAKKAAPKADTEDESGTNLTGVSKDLIKFVERYERLAEERKAIGDDMKEVLGEAKQMGYSTKILRKVLSRRAMDPEQRKEEDALLDLYEEAINGIEKS